MGVGSYGDKTFDTIDDRTVMEYKHLNKTSMQRQEILEKL